MGTGKSSEMKLIYKGRHLIFKEHIDSVYYEDNKNYKMDTNEY